MSGLTEIQEAGQAGWVTEDAPDDAIPEQPMTALVKLNLARSLVDRLGDDLAQAIDTLEKKGPVTESERKRVKMNVSH